MQAENNPSLVTEFNYATNQIQTLGNSCDPFGCPLPTLLNGDGRV
jgi:hypothetical protein